MNARGIVFIVLLSTPSFGCAATEGDDSPLGVGSDNIVNGQPDATHTEVGAMLAYRTGRWYVLCSGSLIGSRAFLTAGHCTELARANGWAVAVMFEQFVTQPIAENIPVYTGVAITHPGYVPNGDGGKNRNDLGIVLLDSPADGVPLGALPRANLLGDLVANGTITAASTNFTQSGYGATSTRGLVGARTFSGGRRSTTTSYSSLLAGNVGTHRNVASGEGGGCFGDSGGATLYATSAGEIHVGVIAIGDGDCASLSFSSRLDTIGARAFLDDYVALP